MTQRILTALVCVPLLIGAIWLGFPWLPILVSAAALLGLWEFYRIVPGARVVLVLGAVWVLLFMVAGQTADDRYDYAPHLLLGAGLLLTVPWLILNRSREGAFTTWAYSIGGPAYLGFLLAHALMLREFDGAADTSRNWLLFAVLVTFATDTGAYFTGRVLGTHPMAPATSPGKTWEGAFGGFLSAIAIAAALGAVLELSVPLWQSSLVGMAVGVVAQMGDLVESRFKRATGVKDAGTVIPGHGGALDRLDSIVLALPVVYYLVALVFKP